MRAALLACVVTAAAASSLAAIEPKVVQLDSGSIKGNIVNNIATFLGVPFAAPPVGALRWVAPQPVTPWTDVLDATWVRNSCVQPHDAFTLFTEESEDCLYLNVFAPVNSSVPGPLPIMLFFYGGSWEEGSASFIVYNPSVVINLVKDVIIITTNYRLGAFGFLGSDSLRAADGSVGNYGLQDQRAAMEWIQRNGAAFGGDVKRVTIFGESAGAGSVTNHLVSPRSQGLFHRALMESGPFAQWSAQSMDIAEAKFVIAAAKLGCCPSSSNCSTNDTSIVDCLRKVNTTTLAANTHDLLDGTLEWSPVIDGVEVVDAPQSLAAQGKIADVPVLFGTNANEGTLFTRCPKDLNFSAYPAWAANRYGQNLSNVVLPNYPFSDYKSPFWLDAEIVGDSMMKCAARRSARWISTSRQNQTDAPGVFVYFFNHTLLVIDLFVPDKGCCHASELAFVFDLEIGLWTKEERELADAFVEYWTSFAANGVPGTATLPQWQAFNLTSQMTAELTTGTINTPLLNFADPICDFWDTVTLPDQIIWGA